MKEFLEVVRSVLRLFGFDICSECNKIIKDYGQGYPICDQCHWDIVTHGMCIHCGNDIKYPFLMCLVCAKNEDEEFRKLEEDNWKDR